MQKRVECDLAVHPEVVALAGSEDCLADDMAGVWRAQCILMRLLMFPYLMTVTHLSECGKEKLKNWHVIPVLRWMQEKLFFGQAGIQNTSSLRDGAADVAIQNTPSLQQGFSCERSAAEA